MKFVKKSGGTFRLLQSTMAAFVFVTAVMPMLVGNSAIAATKQVTWTSQQDFELNEVTTGDPTTRTNVDTSSAPGSVQLGPKQARNNGLIFGRSEGVGMTYNPVTDRIYVSGEQSISILNANTNETVGFISCVGQTLTSLVASTGKNKIYAIDSANNAIVVFDGKNNETLKTIPFAAGAKSLTYNPVAEKIYVTQDSGNVSVIDGNTDEVLSTLAVGTLPNGAVYNQANNRLYVTNKYDISVVDCASEQVIATIPILNSGSYYRLMSAEVNSSGSKIYVSDMSSLVVIDAASNQVTKTIGLAGWSTSTAGMAYDQQHNKLYLAINGSSGLTVIDGQNDTVLKVISFGSQYFALPVACSPSNGKIFAGKYIVDTATDTMVAKQRNLAATDTVHDPINNKMYVLAEDVTVIDAMTSNILRHVDTGTLCYNNICTSPKLAVLNTQNNKLFVIKNAISAYQTPHVSASIALVDTQSYQVTSTVSLPSDYPLDAVYNSRNNKVYVFYAVASTATVLDGETGAILRSITLPKATSYEPKAVYNPVSNKIYVDGIIIDGETDTATGTIAVTGRGTVIPTSSKVYFAYNGITTVDSMTDQVVGTVGSLLPGKEYFGRIAFDAASNHFLAANSNTLYVIDAASGETLETVALSEGGITKTFFNDNNRKTFIMRFNKGTSAGGVIYGISDYAGSGLIGGDAAKIALRSDTFATAGGSTLFDTYTLRYQHAPLLPGQDIRFRVRTADDSASLSAAKYFGPDGTASTWYQSTTPGSVTIQDGSETVIPLVNPGATFVPDFRRYVEIEAELISNGMTPVLHEVKLELTTLDPPLPSSMQQLSEDGAPITKAVKNGTIALRLSGVPTGMFAEFEIAADSSAFTGTPTVAGVPAEASGNSSAALTLDEQKYHWQARFATATGKKSLWTQFPGTLVIDKTPPALGINVNTIGGSREEDATVVVMAGSPMVVGPVQYPTAATWSCTISSLAQGSNPVTVTASDEAGNLTFTSFMLYGSH